MIVIEVTKRYIVGDCTLDNIVESYTDYYNNIDECNSFSEFLSDEMEGFCADEIIVKGDIDSVRKICEMQLQLDNEKGKLLS